MIRFLFLVMLGFLAGQLLRTVVRDHICPAIDSSPVSGPARGITEPRFKHPAGRLWRI